MQEANGTNENTTSATDSDSVDTSQAVEKSSAEPTELLSRRDAIEVGFEVAKASEEKPIVSREREAAPIVKASPLPSLQAPSEWNKEEKADFEGSTRKQQEAALRLHKSRGSTLEEIKKSRQEYDHIRKLSESVNPYIKAMGLKDTPEVAIQKALTMWREFEEGDPKNAIAQYAKAKKVELPEDWLQTNEGAKNNELFAIQQDLQALKSERETAKAEQKWTSLVGEWNAFESIKNSAGEPKFPDLLTEAGPTFAKHIGSLVGGETELSKNFIALTKSRIPDLDKGKLYEEAYKYLGGQVVESTASKIQNNQDHILKSRRAAASVIPKGASSNGSSGAKLLPRSEALKLAFKEYKERNGL